MVQRTVSATEFKAKCLSMITELDQQGGSITVTKRGRPVAVLSPPPKRKRRKSLMGSWAGRGEIVGDIINVVPEEDWDCLNGREWPR